MLILFKSQNEVGTLRYFVALKGLRRRAATPQNVKFIREFTETCHSILNDVTHFISITFYKLALDLNWHFLFKKYFEKTFTLMCENSELLDAEDKQVRSRARAIPNQKRVACIG